MLTIGMPVFNDLTFIEESIKSILNQTFKDFILILSDDCSNDGSAKICKSYAEKDSRIKYIRQPNNIGIPRNMKFLLEQATSKYFMWAADDDLWSEDFVEKLIAALEKKPDAIVSFCTFSRIDEAGEIIQKEHKLDFDHANSSAKERIRNFVNDPDPYDSFGYGIFKTNDIKDVEFPVWWWPNNKTAYGNIYPTLCYYLAKGNYAHVYDNPLFFYRMKSTEKTHHIIPFSNNPIKETLAFFIRRFNLFVFSIKMIRKGRNVELAVSLTPLLLYRWFLIPSWKQLKLLFKRKNV